MTDLRRPISTAALLAAVGVSDAVHGQTFDELPVTSSGSSAGMKVDAIAYARTRPLRSVGASSVFGGLVSGVERGWLPLFQDGFTRPALPFGLPRNGRFWCFAGGNYEESPDFGSIGVSLARPALSGSFAVGGNEIGEGRIVDKLGDLQDVPAPPERTAVWPADVSADGSVTVGTAGFSKKKVTKRKAEKSVRTVTTGKGARRKMVGRRKSAASTTDGAASGSAGGSMRAMVYDSNSSVLLEDVPSHATSVTPDGLAIGGMIDTGGGMQWTRWRFATSSYVPDPPTDTIVGTVRGLSDNGNHLVGSLADGTAAAWIEGTGLVTFGAGDALAVSDDGAVVIGTNATRTAAWIWTSGGGVEPLADFFGERGLPPSSLPLLGGAGMTADGTVMTGWMGALDFVEEEDAPDDPLGSVPSTSAFTISGTLDGGTDAHDVYEIVITDPDEFYATTSPFVDARASAGFDTRLWLFDRFGGLILANDDGPGGDPFLSTISDPADFTALTGGVVAPTAQFAIEPDAYLLVISGYPENGLDAGGIAVSDLDSDFDALHGANPASDGVFASWANPGFTGAGYTIALRGVTSTLPHQAWVADLLACPSDIDGSGAVDFGDILAILSAWGNAGGPEDLDESGIVDFGDILRILSGWGPCPIAP